MFKVFYSWQSDLPNNTNRSFIRQCINEAIDFAKETETIEAERDEATLGTTGSPNIVTTLFSKIDECDLFIADVSLCYTEDQKNEKKSPNPNVLIELGYAVKVLGWERVICLCNTDYGDNYPFDIEHNRITKYSLSSGNNKQNTSRYLSKIIFENIVELREQPVRTKAGFANYIIGSYSFENHKVIKKLSPIDISNQENYISRNRELLEDSVQLYNEILQLLKHSSKQKNNVVSNLRIASNRYEEIVASLKDSYTVKEYPVVWKDKEEVALRIKSWLGFDAPDELFDFSGLKRIVTFPNDSSLVGLDNDKARYEKLEELSHYLVFLEVRTNYLKTFEGMCFIPLAIQNISDIQDENIRVVVSVEDGEIIEPTANLIWSDYDGLQGILCRDDDNKEDIGIIGELFALPEDEVICVENSPYDPSNFIPRIPILTTSGFEQNKKDSDDYQKELKEFIASAENQGFFEFHVDSLRPNECKWFSYGLLLKPNNDTIKIKYRLFSKRSTGDLSGVLNLNVS